MFKLYSYPLQSKPRTDCLFDAFVKCPKTYSPGKVTSAACCRQFQLTKLHILNKTPSWICIYLWLHHLAVKNRTVRQFTLPFVELKHDLQGTQHKRSPEVQRHVQYIRASLNSYLWIQPCTKFPQTKEIFSFYKTVIVLQMLRHH